MEMRNGVRCVRGQHDRSTFVISRGKFPLVNLFIGFEFKYHENPFSFLKCVCLYVRLRIHDVGAEYIDVNLR